MLISVLPIACNCTFCYCCHNKNRKGNNNMMMINLKHISTQQCLTRQIPRCNVWRLHSFTVLREFTFICFWVCSSTYLFFNVVLAHIASKVVRPILSISCHQQASCEASQFLIVPSTVLDAMLIN
jgi:hypothetical protein